MTATPSTNGAKKMARKKVRPGNFRLSRIASSSGSTTRNGTLMTTKMPVALMPFQNGSNCTDPVSNRAV